MQLWALIVDTFRESRDRRIFWLMLIASILTAATMASVTFEPNRVHLFFGAWTLETDRFTGSSGVRPDMVATIVVDHIMDGALGSFGVFLAIMAAAGFFPALLERGGVEVLVSKPLPRWKLFLGKYLGALVFVGFQASVFIGLTFLVVGLRWGVWLPGYLLCIPLAVVLFSYLYCITALVGVVFRSTILAVFLTIVAWTTFVGVQSVGDVFVMYPEWQENRTLYQTVRIARWIVPKTSDFTYIARRWTGSGNPMNLMAPPPPDQQSLIDGARAVEEARMRLSPWVVIGSSLLFEAAVVGLAMVHFCRRDL